MKRIIAFVVSFIIGGLLFSAVPRHASGAEGPQQGKPRLENPSARDARRSTALLAEKVRQELVTLPYYGVFDWIEGEVQPTGVVELRGEVTRPTTRSDAVRRVKDVESVTRVVNDIEVLPVSIHDDQIRLAAYRALFNFNSPLFQYSVRAVPPIHIIVKGGRVTLKGVVLNEMDSQLAETAVRGVPAVFEVTNELNVENRGTTVH